MEEQGYGIIMTTKALSRRNLLAGTLALGAFAAVGRGVSRAQESGATPAAGLDAATEAGWIRFNLNSGSPEQFLTIPAMSDRMVDEFQEYRPYTSIEQFRKEIGKYVSEEEVAAYERYVFVPVDPSQADEATLQQIPGIGADEAAELAKGVPYADANAFLGALAQYVSTEQAGWAPQFVAGSAGATATWVKYNLNTGTKDQFLTIPDMSDRMTDEFAEYRPYTSILQFRKEIAKYVEETQVAAYERYVYVPVDPSQVDADTLQQLPGVSADAAAELAKSVPYADANALLTAVGRVVSADQAAAAAAYVPTA